MKIIFIVIIFLICHSSIAQYKIGDTVSIELINRMLASAQPAVRPSDAANKIIFLDFWGTGCGTCVESMPKIKDLQDRFKNDLLVLYAYHDDSLRFHNFMKKRTDLEPYRLPMTPVTEEMNIFFKHRGIPHIVLIGRDRVIKAITAYSNINKDVMVSLIKNNKVDLPLKWRNFDFDENKRLFQNFPADEIPFFHYSLLSDTIGGIDPGIRKVNINRTTEEKYASISVYNCKIEKLYAELAIGLQIAKRHHVLYHIIWDSLSVPKDLPSKKICYEYMLPSSSISNKFEFYKAVLPDLDHKLGLKSEIKTVEMDCYLMKAPASKSDTSYSYFPINEFRLFNEPLSEIASLLQYQYHKRFPLLLIHDEYGNQRATVNINRKDKSFASLERQLKEQGVELVKVRRQVKVLYIRGAKGG